MKPDIERKIRQDICTNFVPVYGWNQVCQIFVLRGNSGQTVFPKSAADGKRFVKVSLWEEHGSGNNWAGMWLGKAIGMEMQEL
jgi:hypothetical protein